MRSDRRIALILLVTLSCVGCDQVTKSIAQKTLASSKPFSLLGDVFHLTYTENHGAMLSVGAALPEVTRFWLFTVFAGCALIAILIFTAISGRLTPAGVVYLSLVLGGGFSNVLDRLLKGGAVIDFLVLSVGSTRTAVFNLADLAILTGVLVFIIFNTRSFFIDGGSLDVAQ